MDSFKSGGIRLLCCSDVAARGIDIGGLSHVFNFDVPIHAEDYVHRIGRTGRAGREGRAFMLAEPEDRLAVEAIEKLIGHPIPRVPIEGLDPVDWATGDGRRRGRGRTAAPKREAPKREAPRREAPKREPRRSETAPPEQPPPGPAKPERPRPAAAERPAAAAPAPRPERAPRRDDHRHPRRDAEPGPSVLGFGGDVPAFMMVAARPRRPAVPDATQPAEDVEA
jgi:superfamily II DNA/RNA helicase